MIFVSTGGFYNFTAADTADFFRNNGFDSIELSGGLYSECNVRRLISLSKILNFRVHNYFPPPLKPFVFNLASLNPEIYKMSMEHVVKSMQLAVDLGAPIYSFHAGFLLDPRVSELGGKMPSRNLYDRSKSLEVFIDRLNILSNQAYILGVQLLIENNVLSDNNYKQFGCNPFLMVNSDECVNVMQNTPANVNLLIDVAHLKVSANSLNFDPRDFLFKCNDWIKAYHLSDNNGLSDSNECVDNDSWFWPYLKKDLDYYSLEVYEKSWQVIRQQYELTKEKLMN